MGRVSPLPFRSFWTPLRVGHRIGCSVTAEPADTDGQRATPGAPAPSADFYDAAEWTQVLVGIGERFRSRVDGKVLQSMLSELLAAHTEFAAAATADRVRHDTAQAAPGAADRITDKLSGLQAAVGELEATYSTMGSGTDDGSPAGVAEVHEREIDGRKRLAAARAEAELVREQAVTMAESMIAAAADEADRRRRNHDEAIAEGRTAAEAEAVKVLEEALADADFVRTSAEEASARTVAEAEAGAEALRRAVVDEIVALRASAEADIAALRAAHDASPKPDGVAEMSPPQPGTPPSTAMVSPRSMLRPTEVRTAPVGAASTVAVAWPTWLATRRRRRPRTRRPRHQSRRPTPMTRRRSPTVGDAEAAPAPDRVRPARWCPSR